MKCIATDKIEMTSTNSPTESNTGFDGVGGYKCIIPNSNDNVTTQIAKNLNG